MSDLTHWWDEGKDLLKLGVGALFVGVLVNAWNARLARRAMARDAYVALLAAFDEMVNEAWKKWEKGRPSSASDDATHRLKSAVIRVLLIEKDQSIRGAVKQLASECNRLLDTEVWIDPEPPPEKWETERVLELSRRIERFQEQCDTFVETLHRKVN